MKLRVRISRRTSRVELEGEEPTLKELTDHIKEMLLSAHGLSSETEFGLSLNGLELLLDSGQTLASYGIVSGDLISVILPQSDTATTAASTDSSTHAATNSSTNQGEREQNAIMTSNYPSSCGSVESEEICEIPEAEILLPVWEPMLCDEVEEGQAPLSLELLYEAAQATSPNDAIMVAGHLLMLETGFIPQGAELKPGEMPAGWRCAGGVYKLQYTHSLCGDSVTSVVAVCMGAILVINTTLKVTENVNTVRKLSVNASSYVTDDWPGGSAAAAFKDLRKLSRVFKDQLAYPLIAAAREAMALPVAFGLAALPPELLLRILRLLDVQSVVRLSLVSRHLNAATADATLWRHLYRRDFSDSDTSRPRDTDWKELYKKLYKIHKVPRDYFSRDILLPPSHLTPALPHFTPPLLPFPLVPGIIGGEYDQRPNLPPNLLPRPRYDPIGPLADPNGRPRFAFYRVGPMGGRPADARRGFI
ncbi:F-box only protein 7 isoform 2-T2 [Pholidichthys leucotaenia]